MPVIDSRQTIIYRYTPFDDQRTLVPVASTWPGRRTLSHPHHPVPGRHHRRPPNGQFFRSSSRKTERRIAHHSFAVFDRYSVEICPSSIVCNSIVWITLVPDRAAYAYLFTETCSPRAGRACTSDINRRHLARVTTDVISWGWHSGSLSVGAEESIRHAGLAKA